MSDSKSVRVPQLAWSGDKTAELTFPENWDVIPCRMQGYRARKLTDAGFRKAFANPIGTRPIREMARGKKRVVILFDDLSRPTKAYQIVPYVIEELLAGGVEEDNIQFICALGTHGAIQADDFRKKLGTKVVENFRVFNHNPYEHCAYLGRTRRGTPVHINTEFMNADLKIGIGCLVPHPMVGFGGGAKIILPGVSSIETIEYNHHTVTDKAQETGIEANRGMGRNVDNATLLDIQDTCRMAGLDVKVDAIVNEKRDTTALYVGEPIAEYDEGVKLARKHYLSPKPDGAEVIVANANAKVNECSIAAGTAQSLVPESGATIVLYSNNPYGEVQHYLYRKWGENVGSRRFRNRRLAPNVKKFIFLMPYMDKTSADWIAPLEQITWAKTWDQVIDMLKKDYPDGAKVGVIPDGTIQYFGL